MSARADQDAATATTITNPKAIDTHGSGSGSKNSCEQGDGGDTSSALCATGLVDDLSDGALVDVTLLERLDEHDRPKRRRGAVVTLAQVEMRRRRNRASMRRTRQRKLLVTDHLRQQIAVLESQLDSLTAMCAQNSTLTATASNNTPAQSCYTAFDLQELLATIQSYQLEQVRLQRAIQSYEMAAVSLEQLVDEHPARALASNSDDDDDGNTIENDTDDDEAFAWVNVVLPHLPPITTAHARDLVRESFCDIMQSMAIADARGESRDRVLGWSDKRSVSGCMTDFAFSKDFALEDVKALAAKSWTILTRTHERSQCMSSQQVRLRVLERISDDALVMAKSVFCGVEQRHFCSVFVALRMQTARGYVIGSRSLRPLPQHKRRFHDALGDKRAHSDESVGIEVTRLAMATASDSSARGCSVKFAGRVQSENEQLAQRVATNVLLATLRWENACARPLRYLATE